MDNKILLNTVLELKKHGEKILLPIIDRSWIKQLVIWIGAVTGYLFGTENTNILWVLLLLILIDWITGILCAIKLQKPVKSNKLASTVYKVVIYFSLIVTAKLCGESLGFDRMEKLIIAFYVAVEAYSIIENAEKLGVPIPELFRKAIKGRIDQDKKVA